MYKGLIRFSIVAVMISAFFLLNSGRNIVSADSPAETETATAVVKAADVVTPTETTAPTATSEPAVTATEVPPTATKAPVPSETPTEKATSVPPTATSAPKATATETAEATATQASEPTATETVPATVVATPTETSTPAATEAVTVTATLTPTKAPTLAPTATSTPVRKLSPRAGTISSLSTAFVVQNTDPSTTANITATFYDGSGTSTGPINSTIAPFESVTIDQRASGGVPNNPSTYQGSVVLSSNTQLAAVVNEYSGSASSLGTAFRMENYNGVSASAASQSALLPQILKNVFDGGTNSTYNSTIVIQNTDLSNAALATITYYNAATGAVVGTHSSISIAPGASQLIALSSESAVPDPYYGAAAVTADRNIAVLVQQDAAGVLNIYPGYTAANAASTLYVPQLVKNVNDTGTKYVYQSSVIVMSADLTPVDVTVTYYNYNGQYTSTQNGQIASTFDLRYDKGLKSQSLVFASAAIQASKPVIAVVPFFATYDASRGNRSTYFRAFTPGASGATTMYAPEIFKNYHDSGTNINLNTGLTGMLTGTTAANVTISYYDSSGNLIGSTTKSVTPASPVFNFDSRYDTALSAYSSLNASAVLSSSQPFACIVQVFADSTAPGDASGSYLGILP